MVLRVLKGIEERNSLSGKEVARSGSDSGSKIGYNGEVLAGASHKGGAVKAGEYRGKSPNHTFECDGLTPYRLRSPPSSGDRDGAIM